MRLIHYHDKSMEKTHPHNSIISHWVPPTTDGNYGSYKLRFGWGHRARLYQLHVSVDHLMKILKLEKDDWNDIKLPTNFHLRKAKLCFLK